MPDAKSSWGAHAPRVPFSSPSRKTTNAPEGSEDSANGGTQKSWPRGASSTTGGGCPPQVRFSDLSRWLLTWHSFWHSVLLAQGARRSVNRKLFRALKQKSAPSSNNRRATGTPVMWKRSCAGRSEEHTSELQSLRHLVCRLLLEKKKQAMKHSLRQENVQAENKRQLNQHLFGAHRSGSQDSGPDDSLPHFHQKETGARCETETQY